MTDRVVGMTTTTNHTTKRIDEVRFVLRQLLAEIEVAEADAADTKWQDEQESILNAVLSEVASRCDHLPYDLPLMRFTEDSVLTKRETEQYIMTDKVEA